MQIWLIDWQYWEARGLMVSALVPGTSGPGSSPAEYTVLCSYARHLPFTAPLATQEYKWVPSSCQGNLTNCEEVTRDELASRPGGVQAKYSRPFHATETGISSGSYEPFVLKASLVIL